MKKVIVFLFMLLIFTQAFPARIGSLPEVLKPEMMKIFEDELFIVEGASISIFSLKDLTLKRKFGSYGEGPGETKRVPNFSNSIIIYPDFIFLESIDKIAYFSRDGKLKKETKKLQLSSKIVPISGNFVGNNLMPGKNNELLISINLYNSKMEKVKELYRQKFSQQGSSELDLIPDSLNFWVYDNKIFVEESLKGFFVEVFDKDGNKLYQIEKKYKKVKVTDSHKKDAIAKLKEDPMIKAQGFENIKNTVKFNFFDFLPPIKDILVANQRIYVQTFNKKDNQDEFVIMDIKGNILKTIYLPTGHTPRILVQFLGLGPKFYSINKNKIYYLIENVDEEEWELYVTDIE